MGGARGISPPLPTEYSTERREGISSFPAPPLRSRAELDEENTPKERTESAAANISYYREQPWEQEPDPPHSAPTTRELMQYPYTTLPLSCYTTLLVSYSCVDIDALTARNISSNATSAQPAARRAWPAVCVGCGIGCLWSLPLVRELRGSPVCSPKPKRRGPFLLT